LGLLRCSREQQWRLIEWVIRWIVQRKWRNFDEHRRR
jgi:hypothetical protein